MIPIALKMRNFMCYRDNVPPLSFDGIHTVCICGDNGHGKSAMIDAITWALWGKARGKSDDELIHQGQAEMEVEFNFAVGEQPYRIIRKRAKPQHRRRAGQSLLDFQIATDNGFKSLSAETITQTQQRIIDVLHMDYKTFINSAFLRQGHADEFTTKRPVDRKQVLADILQLSFYDQLAEQAKEQARQQETLRTQLETTISDINQELSHQPAYQAELAQAQQALDQSHQALTGHEAMLTSRRQARDSLQNQQQQLAQLEKTIAATEKEGTRWQQQIDQRRHRLSEYQAVIAQRDDIEAGYRQLIITRQQNDELNDKLSLMARLTERKGKLIPDIEKAGSKLITEHTLAQTKITELETTSQKLPHLKSELGQAVTQRQQLLALETQLNQKRQCHQELQTQMVNLQATRTRLDGEIAEIKEKIDLLVAQTEPQCPLCETELGNDELKRIQSKYAADRKSKNAALRSTDGDLAANKSALEAVVNEIRGLEAELKQQRAAVEGKTILINQEIARAEDAASQLSERRQALTEIEHRLAVKDYARPEQRALAEIKSQIAKLDYSPQQHEQVGDQMKQLEPYDRRMHQLEEADLHLDPEKEALTRAEEASADLHRRLDTDCRQRQQLTDGLVRLPQAIADLEQAEAEHQQLAAQQRQAQETSGRVQAKLERCAELEIKLEERRKSQQDASQMEAIYRDLVQAFGKKGVQALIIEQALPEIETEASRLLARMTDNRMQVKIETQRGTKKGDPIETLDINISDELGTRNYEMFSGGEAFRINFALRIALAKLLARRAGARLPTLIIDEGFGTQDSTGMERVKEAINSIQDDFDKILVITHIEELKDAFPIRINVIKTAEGSTLEIS